MYLFCIEIHQVELMQIESVQNKLWSGFYTIQDWLTLPPRFKSN